MPKSAIGVPLFFLLISFATFFLGNPKCALAAGAQVHLMMSEAAINKVSDQDLKQLLIESKGAYLSGTVYADSGYAIKTMLVMLRKYSWYLPKFFNDKVEVALGQESSRRHFYGETSHWDPFLKNYRETILADCKKPWNRMCKNLLAHYLGTEAHSTEDVNFDRHFLSETYKRDFVNVPPNQSDVDIGLDFVAVMKDFRFLHSWTYFISFPTLMTAYAKTNEEFSYNDLKLGTTVYRTLLVLEKMVTPVAYFRYKGKLAWAASNYHTAKGGIEDTSVVVAKRLDEVWSLINDSERKR